MRVVTCRTVGCPNEGIEFLWNYEQQLAEAQEGGWTIGPYFCGGCSTEITDIREVPDDYVPPTPDDPYEPPPGTEGAPDQGTGQEDTSGTTENQGA